MAGYVQNQLITDERIEYQAKIHWAVYLKGLLMIAVGFLIMASEILLLPTLLIVLGTIALLWAFIFQRTTELVITNKRVIAKFGVVSRHAFEQQLSKVDGANLEQSLLGRMMGFASVVVRGSGGTGTPIPYIERADHFKRELSSRIA